MDNTLVKKSEKITQIKSAYAVENMVTSDKQFDRHPCWECKTKDKKTMIFYKTISPEEISTVEDLLQSSVFLCYNCSDNWIEKGYKPLHHPHMFHSSTK